jgi:colicin import membrane protein
MKPLLLCLALLGAASPAWAQTDAPDGAGRARIAAERKQAQARLASEEAACYRIFAVNDCLKAARARSRERLSDLRRQEVALNDAERERRAAERQRAMEEGGPVRKQQESAARRAEAVARQQEKTQALARHAAEKAQPPAPPAPRMANKLTAPDTAQELRRSQERQQDAKERQERVARRQAEAANSGVKPLPVPP